jgi:hypothetical protein
VAVEDAGLRTTGRTVNHIARPEKIALTQCSKAGDAPSVVVNRTICSTAADLVELNPMIFGGFRFRWIRRQRLGLQPLDPLMSRAASPDLDDSTSAREASWRLKDTMLGMDRRVVVVPKYGTDLNLDDPFPHDRPMTPTPAISSVWTTASRSAERI